MKDWEAAIFSPLTDRKIIPDPDSSRSVAGYVLNSFSKYIKNTPLFRKPS